MKEIKLNTGGQRFDSVIRFFVVYGNRIFAAHSNFYDASTSSVVSKMLIKAMKMKNEIYINFLFRPALTSKILSIRKCSIVI